jgi:uncharacterized protein YfiM (DUF2279 family)
MAFTAAGPRIWPVTPDWTNGVQETLTFATDYMQASGTAVTQHRGLRAAPRRSLGFSVLSSAQERRSADMLLAGHRGTWSLPLWPDVIWLAASLAAGASEVPCVTAGRDFVAGGKALLYTAVNRFELVDVDVVLADHITLASPTQAAFGPGDRLYPVRQARIQEGAEETLRSDDVGRRSVVFDLAEPCDWPLLTDVATYLGHLVLTVRPDESEDPTSSYSRLIQTVDYGAGLPVAHDLPGIALRAQQTHWKLFGRVEHTWYRSLLYTLDGRRVPMWIPSWTADLVAIASIAGSSALLHIEWAGYTLFGLGKPNRRDVRIELVDGTVYYRRITAAAEVGATETLALDSPLSTSGIAPERIRMISIMALSSLASDEVEIEHVTDADGVATSTIAWQAVVPDV